MAAPQSVDQYIRAAPVETQAVLKKVRSTIQVAAPDAEESMSYGMPFYSYRGEVGVERRLCYFGLHQASVALFLRPKDLDPHADQIAPFRTSKSGLRFPLDQPIPRALIKKLLLDAVRRHRKGAAK
jgi:uncharacterized protein YdhG (YjbR/CyaY superfamily)